MNKLQIYSQVKEALEMLKAGNNQLSGAHMIGNLVSLIKTIPLDLLKLCFARYQIEEKTSITESVFTGLLALKKNELEQIHVVTLIRIIECFYDPLTVFRSMTSRLRDFINYDISRDDMPHMFAAILDMLDVYIESKSDPLEHGCYYLFDRDLGFETPISLNTSFFEESCDYSIHLMLSFDINEPQEILSIIHCTEKHQITIKLIIRDGKALLTKNESSMISITLENEETSQFLFSYLIDGTGRIKLYMNGVIKYEEFLPQILSQPNWIEDIQCIPSFSGRLHFVFTALTSNHMLASMLSELRGRNTDENKRIESMSRKLDCRFEILSRFYTSKTRAAFKIEELHGIPFIGKTQFERNLSYSPGLPSLLPMFSLLKISKKEELAENMRKLLVIAGVVISQISADNLDDSNLDFPKSLAIILNDLISKRNLLFNVTIDISNLFFLIYENCIHLGFRKIWLRCILTEWKFYSNMNSEEYDEVMRRFMILIANNAEIDHSYLLLSILEHLDTKSMQSPKNRQINLKNFPVSMKNPFSIYKELLDLSNIQLPILKSIFVAFVELAGYTNSAKTDIIFLGLIKKLLKILLEKEKVKLNLEAATLLVRKLIQKFSMSKLEIKNEIMEILYTIMNTIDKTENTVLSHFYSAFDAISDEINRFVEDLNTEKTSFKNERLSSMGLSEKKKGGSIVSNMTDRFTPKSYKSSTPKGDITSEKKLELSLKSAKKSMMNKKNINLNMQLINEDEDNGPTQMMVVQSTKMKDNRKLKLDKLFSSVADKNERSPAKPASKGFKNKRNEFLKKKELELDTDGINQLYNFGGEKGYKIANAADDRTREEKIAEIAQEIVNILNGQNPSEFEAIEPLPTHHSKTSQQMRSAPISIRKEKKISFDEIAVKKQNLKIITEQSNSIVSGSPNHTNNPPSSSSGARKLKINHIFRRKIRSPLLLQEPPESYLLLKTVTNYIKLLTLDTYTAHKKKEDIWFGKGRYSSPSNSLKKTVQFTPKKTGQLLKASTRPEIDSESKPPVAESVRFLDYRLISCFHSIFSISPDSHHQKLIELLSIFAKTERLEDDQIIALSKTFQEALAEILSSSEAERGEGYKLLFSFVVDYIVHTVVSADPSTLWRIMRTFYAVIGNVRLSLSDAIIDSKVKEIDSEILMKLRDYEIKKLEFTQISMENLFSFIFIRFSRTLSKYSTDELEYFSSQVFISKNVSLQLLSKIMGDINCLVSIDKLVIDYLKTSSPALINLDQPSDTIHEMIRNISTERCTLERLNILMMKDETFKSLPKKFTLGDFIILSCVGVLNKVIRDEATNQRDTVIQVLAILKRQIKILCLSIEFTKKQQPFMPMLADSCSASLHCCLMVVFASLKELSSNIENLREEMNNSMKDIMIFVCLCMRVQFERNPSLFSTKKPIVKPKGFFNAASDQDQVSSPLFEFSETYLMVGDAPQGKQGRFSFSSSINEKRQLFPQEFLEKINTRNGRSSELFTAAFQDFTNLEWLTCATAKKKMERMKYNFVEIKREFKKFSDNMQQITSHSSPSSLPEKRVDHKLKYILKAAVEAPRFTPQQLKAKLGETLLLKPEWVNFNDLQYDLGQESSPAAVSRVFGELDIADSNYIFNFVKREMLDIRHSKGLFEWRMLRPVTYFKEADIIETFANDSEFGTSRIWKAFYITHQIKVSCIVVLDQKSIFVINTEIPKESENVKIDLTRIKRISRYRSESQFDISEIYLIDNTGFMIRFKTSQEQEDFSRAIIRLRKRSTINLEYEGTLSSSKLFKIAGYKKLWEKGRISTFAYLMQINRACSRSFLDIDSRPMLPSIIRNESTGEFTICISGHDSAITQNEINFLVHKAPYSKIGGGALPFVDCKVLDEEPYLFADLLFDPSIFIHSQSLRNVKLPIWAEDAFKYIYQLRKELESDSIAALIPGWIDQHFGVNMDEGQINLAKRERLFKSPHPEKKSSVELKKFGFSNRGIKVFEPFEDTSLTSSYNQINKLFCYENKQEILILKEGVIQLCIYERNKATGSFELIPEFEINSEYDIPEDSLEAACFSWNRFCLIYPLEGCIFFYNISTRNSESCELSEDKPVSCMDLGRSENLLIIGFESGEVSAYNIQHKHGKHDLLHSWDKVVAQGSFEATITCIKVYEGFGCVVAGTYGGFVVVFSLGTGSIINILRHPQQYPISFASISVDPFCFLTFSSRIDTRTMTYSLTNHQLAIHEGDRSQVSSLILKSGLLGDLLVELDSETGIKILQLPYFEEIQKAPAARKLDGKRIYSAYDSGCVFIIGEDRIYSCVA